MLPMAATRSTTSSKAIALRTCRTPWRSPGPRRSPAPRSVAPRRPGRAVVAGAAEDHRHRTLAAAQRHRGQQQVRRRARRRHLPGVDQRDGPVWADRGVAARWCHQHHPWQERVAVLGGLDLQRGAPGRDLGEPAAVFGPDVLQRDQRAEGSWGKRDQDLADGVQAAEGGRAGPPGRAGGVRRVLLSREQSNGVRPIHIPAAQAPERPHSLTASRSISATKVCSLSLGLSTLRCEGFLPCSARAPGRTFVGDRAFPPWRKNDSQEEARSCISRIWGG
jgi:hypothetical protein